MASDDFRDVVKERYGFETWERPELAVSPPPYLPELTALEGFRHLERVPQSRSRHSFTDVLEGSDPEVRLGVTISQFDGAEQAQEALVTLLTYSMAPRLPRCEERGLRLGEVCFCGFDDPATSVWFTRGNVLVQVENFGTREIAVGAVAEELDRQVVMALGMLGA